MGNRFHQLAFTDGIKAIQTQKGSRAAYARGERAADTNHRLGDDEVAFIEARDSFYMATVSETGWPYVQHRGGPPGFVKALDATTLLVPDVRGNKQYISVGNVGHDDRVALIFMDYPGQTRLKLLGRVTVLSAAEGAALKTPTLDERPVERYLKVHVEALDWNCPQGITPRYTQEEVRELIKPMLDRLEQAEALLAKHHLSIAT